MEREGEEASLAVTRRTHVPRHVRFREGPIDARSESIERKHSRRVIHQSTLYIFSHFLFFPSPFLFFFSLHLPSTPSFPFPTARRTPRGKIHGERIRIHRGGRKQLWATRNRGQNTRHAPAFIVHMYVQSDMCIRAKGRATRRAS